MLDAEGSNPPGRSGNRTQRQELTDWISSVETRMSRFESYAPGFVHSSGGYATAQATCTVPALRMWESLGIRQPWKLESVGSNPTILTRYCPVAQRWCDPLLTGGM